MTAELEYRLGQAMAKQAKKDGHVAALPKGDNKPTRREIALRDARNAKVVLDVISTSPNALTTTGVQKRLEGLRGGSLSYDRILRALKQLKDLGKINSEVRAGVLYHECPFKPLSYSVTNEPIPFFEPSRAKR